MNNTARPGMPPPLSSLIRPEMIQGLEYFPEASKAQYREGVTKLWARINTNPPESAEYQQAYKKLIEASMNIKSKMAKEKQDLEQRNMQAMAAAQQNGARPMSSGQPGQQNPRPQTQGGGQPQGQEKFSAAVIEAVRKAGIIAPPSVAPNLAANWIQDAQNKYAVHLQTLERCSRGLENLQRTKKQREDAGKPLSQQEAEMHRVQRENLEQNQRSSKENLSKFQHIQESIRAQQAQAKAGTGPNTVPNTSQAPNSVTHTQEHKAGMGGQPQMKKEPQSQPHTVSSAVDAARNQANTAQRSAMSPQNNIPPTHPPNQPPNSRPQPNQNQIPNSYPPLNVNTNSRPPDHQHNSPHVAPSQPISLPQDPVPLSHAAAMEQARTYSQPNIHQSTPQSATHAHPQDQRNNQNHAKMPIPKDLPLNPPQPVSMGPSRPTLTNGPVAMGPMGQPAIQRHPGYVLEGKGERVLSKKKLEELVRQVTGGTGGEGEEGESLTAEVEETLLQVADEFVDQVIVAACRLAKLRQSSTLELRDLQLILERNYNIRVPGYASDELRTVKKVVPTQAWTQKLSAVQAAKVTGGKGDL
ncbi:hypothetical protein OEA41_006718 [Lepraria neglecta]|uniref:Transcription initiation factor TFIID subunit 12 domain-containing protein n=1 Tax=Lepraria neglecta TaxID=209136 RepID=A0AAD9Z8I1_9LECA|nr:hypothetical protein OEA41_006718 [Lepraria neglecta]